MKNPTTTPPSSAAGRLQPAQWLGVLLVRHFGFVCGYKLGRGLGVEIWWISHVALLMAGAGLILRRPLWWTAALTNVCMLHVLWLFDLVCWAATGRFPLGICGYLLDSDAAVWIATLHHIYLLPVLAVLFWRERKYPAAAFPTAIAVFLYLTLISRACLPNVENVNFAFRVSSVTRNPVSIWLNQLPDEAYLPALNLLATVLFFAPVALLLWRCRKVAACSTAPAVAGS
jgi:hypothetical protein